MTSVRQVVGASRVARSSPTSCGDQTTPVRCPGRADTGVRPRSSRCTASTRDRPRRRGVVAMSTSSSPPSPQASPLGCSWSSWPHRSPTLRRTVRLYVQRSTLESAALPEGRGAAVAALLAMAATGWLVGGILAAVAVLVLPGILGGKAARQQAIDRTEAIASWTEMIRDSIVAASGLEEAIVATAPSPTTDLQRGTHDGETPRPRTTPGPSSPSARISTTLRRPCRRGPRDRIPHGSR